MKSSIKLVFVFLVGMILIIASIPITFLIISNNHNHEYIHIEFIPKNIKSYPNHTTWLLLDVRTKSSDLMSNLSLVINTNTSVKMKYEIWETSPLNKVIEVFLYPNITHIDNKIEIEAFAYSGEFSKRNYAVVSVIDWIFESSPEIETMKDTFVSFLGNNHPKFRLNETIVWDLIGKVPQILVVEHYLYKSKYWELELAKHATIAPHDWVKIYLRPRFSLFPNWSGIINSWSSENHTIIEIEAPNEIYR